MRPATVPELAALANRQYDRMISSSDDGFPFNHGGTFMGHVAVFFDPRTDISKDELDTYSADLERVVNDGRAKNLSYAEFHQTHDRLVDLARRLHSWKGGRFAGRAFTLDKTIDPPATHYMVKFAKITEKLIDGFFERGLYATKVTTAPAPKNMLPDPS